MGLRDYFKRSTPETYIEDPVLRAIMSKGEITKEDALTIPSIAGAVDFIANCVACMPVKLYRYTNGSVEEVEDTRVPLLNGDTGDTLNGYQLKKAMVTDYLLDKGGYAFIKRQRNDVKSIHYVDCEKVTIFKTSYDPIYKGYKLMVGAKSYMPWEFLKIIRMTKDGASGKPLTDQISKALDTMYQTMKYQLGLVKTGGNKRGFLKSNRKLGEEEMATLKTAWANLYRNNTENIVLLNNGLEFQEASNSLVEMQLNESKQTFDREIDKIFHIHEDFERTFKEAIYPIIKQLETTLNRDLLLESEKSELFFEMDVKEIVKASIKERYEAYKLAKDTGFLTINEIRKDENLNKIEGMDVINVGLSAVLYDTENHTYYTPNTNSTETIEEVENETTN